MHASSWPRQSSRFALFYFGYFGYIGIFSPYASLYFSHRGMSAAEIGILMAVMQVMRVVGPNLWGWVADIRQRRVGVLRVTAMAGTLSFCALFYGGSFTYFFGVMIVLSFFTSAHAPLSDALVLAALRGDMTYYGRLRLWGSVGFILSVVVAGPLLDWKGIDAMPWLALCMLVLVLVASLRMQEVAPPQEMRATPPVLGLLRRRDVLAFFCSTFLMLAAHAALYVYYSLHLSRIGYSNTFIGLMWSLGVLVEILFFYFQATLFKRFGVRKLMVASLLLAVVRFLLIGYGAQSLLLLLGAQVLHAATFGIHHSASIATLQYWFSGPLLARGQALFTSISYGLGGTMGALLLSQLWDSFGPQSVYLAAAILSLFGAAAAILCYRWHEECRKKEARA